MCRLDGTQASVPGVGALLREASSQSLSIRGVQLRVRERPLLD